MKARCLGVAGGVRLNLDRVVLLAVLALVLPAVLFVATARADDVRSEHAVFGPEWIPPDSDLAVDLRTLSLRGRLPARLWTLRPVTRMETARLLIASATGAPVSLIGVGPDRKQTIARDR